MQVLWEKPAPRPDTKNNSRGARVESLTATIYASVKAPLTSFSISLKIEELRMNRGVSKAVPDCVQAVMP